MNKISLSEIANITMGQSPAGAHCGDDINGLPLLNGPAEFTDLYPIPVQYTSDPKRRSKEGDILLCVRGSTTGRMNWSDQEYAIGRGLAALSHKKGNEYNHFLKYRLKSVLPSLLNNANGSTFPNLTSDILANFLLDTPGEQIEKNISKFLSAIDKKITLNNQINTELETIAKLIFDYWFVQFDFPDAKGKPYKSSGGKLVYNEELKREIPEGWEMGSLGDFIKTSLGGTPSTKKSEYWDNANICWLNSGEVASFPVLGSELQITQEGIANSAAKLMPKGSVIISIVRHIRVSILAIDAAFNQSVVGLHETNTLKSSFLYPYLSREIPRLMMLRTGAQQPHINKKVVDDSYIVIPNENTLVEYYTAVTPIFEKINLTAIESKKLEELRDWLLPLLMNAQVTVKDTAS